ncbi:Hpt domain-containing protein [Pantanalinema sp. GBBB05]|uniref:Hpt domain-containing protein n=1 Tax=Pantanalinema sp. GBBB05 TaxID=2604139 RepID=UPI001D556EED|nr:histidine kinase [Pantanalinema sp. GBBB05]
MQATKQQQIVVYFIEEAKEHLDTIEKGLLNLQSTMADPEQMNELFRAAHSVKGGAAMLGFGSIQKVGHHLEDCFKLLKENSVKVDQQVETLFLQGFDTLKELIEELQSPYGLREEDAMQSVQAVEPAFHELQAYILRLIQGVSAAPAPTPAKASKDIGAVVNQALKLMLQLFKQGDTPTTRQQLATLCSRMAQLHASAEWQHLTQTAQQAIANPKNSYAALAPVLIKDLKQAGELLVAGKPTAIAPSPHLQRLAPVAQPAPVAPATVSPLKPAVPVEPAREATGKSMKPQQISVPLEPRAAARVLLGAFNKNQLIELADFIMKAIQ